MTKNFIPLSVPNLKGNEKKYVTKAIEDEWVSTGGEYINRFEKEIAEYLHVDKAVAVQSGTAGLHLALMQSGVLSGEEVLTSPLTFIAAVNPIKYIGANPVFIDCNDSLCLDPKKVQDFIENECSFSDGFLMNKKTGKLVKAIIVVHVFGNLADMESLMRIAKQYNLKVIEDATEALGSYYEGGMFDQRFAGSVGDFGVFSFNGNKIITSGGGGMVIGKETEDLDKIKYLSTQAKDDELKFIHHEIGYNYRMTNIQAAVGVAQLEQLESFIETKKKNYHEYLKIFETMDDVELIKFRPDSRPNYWFYSLYLKNDLFVDYLISRLSEEGIQTRPIWGLICDQKPYVDYYAKDVENAKDYVKHVVNIPCSSNLTNDDVQLVGEKILALIKEANENGIS